MGEGESMGKSNKICMHCKHFVRYYSMEDEIFTITYHLENCGHCGIGKSNKGIKISTKGCENWELNTPRTPANKSTYYNPLKCD